MEDYYTIAMEIKSETYFGKGLFLFDLMFIAMFWFIMSSFETVLHEAMVFPYTVFNIFIGFLLTRKSMRNPGKRIYESLLYSIIAAVKKRKYHSRERSYHAITYREYEEER